MPQSVWASPNTAAVLIPIKAFRAAKHRLASLLDEEQRAALARAMASRVVAAAGGLPVTIVCDDDEVAAWAEAVRAAVLWRPGVGLNEAVSGGVRALADRYDEIIVTHADLPRARDLSVVRGFAGVTLVPDRRRDGTNVICLPSQCGFRFGYGVASFARHCDEAERIGQPLRVLSDDNLAFDIDTPDDLLALRESGCS
jgi:2-phospho-L-lactate guanylyltransferase